MTTKRSIKNDVEDLKSREGVDSDPLVCVLTHCDGEDSPHPELTIQPHPEQKPQSHRIAVPILKSVEYLEERWFTVHTCENAEKFGLHTTGNDDSTVTACELWDALTDDDLEREKELRKERDEPIPPILENL
ncbi:hypothetical protein [Natronorubrum daqingense]|uniref:Uncharacterized protein n=1 Tax=Natronorubrum daqingense TaxID=588898 RepID=A0A1N7F643_9EURY|nr:hypothetical protein [Natronorubrum daqingense]APX97556.1 hypothetical protein BB347_13585 [Natronorubrum daqingense]SIR95705.1 hypothetical protein SAMN05421809_3032 [Natronorubrum daqingense]